MTPARHLDVENRILAILESHGRPVQDLVELRDLWGPYPPSVGDLTRALWALNRDGDIKFKEYRTNGVSLLTSIRLPRGIDTSVMRTHESKGRHRVGKDLTDPWHHSHIAQGGPIERIRVPVQKETPMTDTYIQSGPKPKDNSKWLEYVNAINPNRVRPILPLIADGQDRPILIQKQLGFSSARITSLVSRAEVLGWLTKEKVARDGKKEPGGVKLILTDEGSRLAAEPFIDDGKGRRPHEVKTDTPTQYRGAPADDNELLPIDSGTMATVEVRPKDDVDRFIDAIESIDAPKWPNLTNYPLISDLMTKEDRINAYEAAAKLLEGFDQDLALSLLEKIQLTPLEQEVIAFVRSLR